MTIKQKVIYELQTKNFPDLKFLYSNEVLDIAIEILEDFLEQEKKDFQDRLKIKDENIVFDIFNKESDLSYFWSLLNHLSNVQSSDKIRKIIEDFEPKLVDFSNEISYSKRNYDMLEILLKSGSLDIEQQKIIKDDIKGYKVRGINLKYEKQEELKKINLELSELSTNFSNNVLDSEKEFEYFLDNDEFLKEFPESDLENAKNLAKKKGKLGFAFDSSASSYISIMKYCSDSKVRKYFSETQSSFASSGKYDNREIVLKLISLKNKKAKILGYKSYAELSLEFKMAKNPEQVLSLLEELSTKSKPKALLEIEEIKNYFGLDEIDSWDMPYYSRILKEKKYKLDDKKLKEYFEFENTKKALFETVKKLYDIEMKRIMPQADFVKECSCLNSNNENPHSASNKGSPHLTSPKGSPHLTSPRGRGIGNGSQGALSHSTVATSLPLGETEGGLLKGELDIEVYEVYKGGKFISYFMGDYFHNENKRSGAWANELRDRYEDKKSIVINNMSFIKNKSGKTLLTLGEVETLFHEFGHAIHSMLSKSRYSDLSGFGVEWDFVELPSQILEKWCSDIMTINNVARHYESGEKLGDDMLQSLEKLKYFGTGNFVLGQNTYSICDMMFHSGEKFKNIKDLDNKFLEKINSLSIFKKEDNYKMYCSFGHIFSGGYSAGYYSYMWADIIVDEIWKVFKENGVYDEATAKKFEQTILGAGSIKKSEEMFLDFMGREVKIDAFLEEKGLI